MPSENLAIIQQLLETQHKLSVAELAASLSVSEVSIRKYLQALERDGVCIRTHGGAVLASPQQPATSIPFAQKITTPQKRSIAKTASELITPGARIIIDSGSTTAQMLPFLQAIPDLVIMTNSLPIATALTQQSQNATVLMCGGTWDPVSQSFQGQMSEKMIASYNFELAFVGASGIDLAAGTTTFHELTKLSQVMSQVSARTVVLAESSKLDKKMPNIELAWSQISTFVTDNQINNDALHRIEQKGVNVLVATDKE